MCLYGVIEFECTFGDVCVCVCVLGRWGHGERDGCYWVSVHVCVKR